MKINYKITVLAIVSSLVVYFGFTSCEEFYDVKPGDKIKPGENYKNAIDASLASEGVYSLFQDIVPQMVLVNELLSDNAEITQNSDEDLKDIYYHRVDENNKYSDPAGYYKIIIAANEALANIESIKEKDGDYSQIFYQIHFSNLVGMRTWAYLNLVKLYGEAAYFTDNMDQLPDNITLEYWDRNRVLDQLLVDMDTVYTSFGAYGGSEYWGENFMDNALIIGEIFLEKQDYENAAMYLMGAMGGAAYGTQYKVSNVFLRDKWVDIFKDSHSQDEEVMNAVPFSFTNDQLNPLYEWTAYNREYIIRPTKIIRDLFDNQITNGDEIGDEYRGVGVSYDTIDNELVIKKHNLELSFVASSDVIIYRAGDAHLMLAEALNRLGLHDDAMLIVNDGLPSLPGWSSNMGIRGRVYLQNLNIPAGVADSTNYVEDVIMEERMLELAFEGKRWTDLMRVARRRGSDYLANRVAAKYDDPAIAEEVRNYLMDETNWYLPFKK